MKRKLLYLISIISLAVTGCNKSVETVNAIEVMTTEQTIENYTETETYIIEEKNNENNKLVVGDLTDNIDFLVAALPKEESPTEVETQIEFPVEIESVESSESVESDTSVTLPEHLTFENTTDLANAYKNKDIGINFETISNANIVNELKRLIDTHKFQSFIVVDERKGKSDNATYLTVCFDATNYFVISANKQSVLCASVDPDMLTYLKYPEKEG